MTNRYRATFSNGHVHTGKNIRQPISHAWHARGFHRLKKESWSFHGFSCSADRAARNMAAMISFAQDDQVEFSEVVPIESGVTK